VRTDVGIRRLLVVGATLIAAAALATAPVAASSVRTASRTAGSAHTVQHDLKHVPAGKPKDAVFGCQLPGGPTDIFCYSPQQMRTAYGVDKLIKKGFDGRGRTIVIIDAFQNPTMQEDLAAFDDAFGLPAPVFRQVAPQGLTPFDPTDGNMIGWSGEIALDVEWSHAIAPGAKILLVLAKSNDDADILAATKWAVDHNVGDVISQSFGESEDCVDPKIARDEHKVFQAATRKGITLFASAGDEGSAEPSCDGNGWVKDASSPASDPLVTGVGGTELFAATDQVCFDAKGNLIPCPPQHPAPGTYDHEVVWDELDQDPVVGPLGGDVAGGGGFSNQFRRPDFQDGIQGIRSGVRGVPDVSYSGSINHGVIAAWNITDPDNGGFFIFGGTSAGSPQWAALTAIGDQMGHHRLGTINPSLYQLASSRFFSNALYHDITVGQNGVMEFNADKSTVVIPGFTAKRGWDAASGLGSPRADRLIPALVLLSH
jgi:subtilase family serine protease